MAPLPNSSLKPPVSLQSIFLIAVLSISRILLFVISVGDVDLTSRSATEVSLAKFTIRH